MSDLDILIETTYRLSNTLGRLAEDERKFSYTISCMLIKVSKEMVFHAETLDAIKFCMEGGE